MPINPLIPLSVDANQINNQLFSNIRQDQQLKSNLETQAVGRDESQARINALMQKTQFNKENQPLIQAQLAQELQTAQGQGRIKSLALAGQEAKSILASRDLDGAIKWATNRIQMLKSQGKDSSDTEEFLAKVTSGDIAGAMADANNAIQLGAMSGVIKSPNVNVPKVGLVNSTTGEIVQGSPPSKEADFVTLQGPSGDRITLRKDDPKADELIKNGYNKANQATISSDILMPLLKKTLQGDTLTADEQKTFDMAKSIGFMEQLLRSLAPQNQTMDTQPQVDEQAILSKAREKAAKGGDVNQIKEILRSQGIDPAKL